METWGDLFWRAYVRTRISWRNWKRENWPPTVSSWQFFTATGIVSIVLTIWLLPKAIQSTKPAADTQITAADPMPANRAIDRETEDPFATESAPAGNLRLATRDTGADLAGPPAQVPEPTPDQYPVDPSSDPEFGIRDDAAAVGFDPTTVAMTEEPDPFTAPRVTPRTSPRVTVPVDTPVEDSYTEPTAEVATDALPVEPAIEEGFATVPEESTVTEETPIEESTVLMETPGRVLLGVEEEALLGTPSEVDAFVEPVTVDPVTVEPVTTEEPETTPNETRVMSTAEMLLGLDAPVEPSAELPKTRFPTKTNGNSYFRFGEHEDAEEKRHSVTELRPTLPPLPEAAPVVPTLDFTDPQRSSSYRRLQEVEDEEEGRHSVQDLRPTRVDMVLIPRSPTATPVPTTETPLPSQPKSTPDFEPVTVTITETELPAETAPPVQFSEDEPAEIGIRESAVERPFTNEEPAFQEFVEPMSHTEPVLTQPRTLSGDRYKNDDDESFRTGNTSDLPEAKVVPFEDQPIEVPVVETEVEPVPTQPRTLSGDRYKNDDDESFRTGNTSDLPEAKVVPFEEANTAEPVEAMPEEPVIEAEPVLPVETVPVAPRSTRSEADDEDFRPSRPRSTTVAPVAPVYEAEPVQEEPLMTEETPEIVTTEDEQPETPVLPEFAPEAESIITAKPIVEGPVETPSIPADDEAFQPPQPVEEPRTTSPRVTVPSRVPAPEPMLPVEVTPPVDMPPERVIEPTAPVTTRVNPARGPAQLVLKMTAPETAIAGSYVTLKFRVENNGESPATRVMITSVLPSGLQHRLSSDLEYLVGDLAPGAVQETHMVVKCLTPGSVTNKALALADGNLATQATVQFQVLSGPVPAPPTTSRSSNSPVNVTHRGPEHWLVDSTGQFMVTVSNPSGADLQNVVVTQNVPKGTALIQATPGAAIDVERRTVTWRIDRLPAGVTYVLQTELFAASSGPQTSQVEVKLPSAEPQVTRWTAIAD